MLPARKMTVVRHYLKHVHALSAVPDILIDILADEACTRRLRDAIARDSRRNVDKSQIGDARDARRYIWKLEIYRLTEGTRYLDDSERPPGRVRERPITE